MNLETKYGIKIDSVGLSDVNARIFKQNTRKHLSWIEGTKVGQFLLKGIGWHARNNPGNLTGGTIAIQPYTGTDCNAVVNNSVSTATGWSQPVVNYSPGVFNKSGACINQLKHVNTNRGLYPDELLFHELVHAFRGASAMFKAFPTTGGLINYTGTEEFVAVLTTNIYISDPSNGSKTGLRKDHIGFTKLEPIFSDSFNFFKSSTNAFTLVDQFCKENPSFTRWIAGVKAPFNPIAAYYADKAKAQSLSNSALALVRDGEWQKAMNKIIQDLLTP